MNRHGKRKQVLAASGEKGGVGKSLALTAAIEHALLRGRRVFLVEGDPSVPDVQLRYQGVLQGVQASLQRPDSAGEATVELFNAIESVWDQVDLVAINLPAGAAATVDAMAQELIAPTLAALGAELTTLYVLGPGEESVVCLEESLSSGLCSISQRCIAVPNGFFGDPGRFVWSGSALRRAWLEAGHGEVALPKLIPRVSERVRGVAGPLHAIAQGRAGGLSLVERAGLSGWLRACEGLADLALGDAEGLAEDAA
jgi:hypothetical protein